MPSPDALTVRGVTPRARLLLPALLSAALSACVTVNIYFPAPEVREAAEQIVEETWGAPAAPAPKPPGPQSRVLRGLLLAVGAVLSPAEAHAADPDVNVSTASIRALKESMRTRAAALRPHMASGLVGIGRDGMLVERDASGADLATKAKVRRLVDAENRDREALYREIATANNYGSDRVDDIRRIFAQAWKDKAEPGWWVQDASGSWKRK